MLSVTNLKHENLRQPKNYQGKNRLLAASETL
jgi:hypothetical protein